MLFATEAVASAQLLKYPRVISSGCTDLWAPYLNGQSCIQHTWKKFIPPSHQVCSLWPVVFVAVEREAHDIRLRVGSNDVLAKVSPNYLAKLTYLTAIVEQYPFEWTVKC